MKYLMAPMGIVNLFVPMQYQGKGEAASLFSFPQAAGWNRDLLPDLESYP